MAPRLRLLQYARAIVESYWFIPAVLAVLGLGAGIALVFVDVVVGERWLGHFDWLYGSRAEGARAVLSTVAGSMITVAGVVFSITLAAVTYASGQHGPRLLNNFVQDRGNQAVLGVFIATFLYCLVVLRTVRSAGEAMTDGSGGAFVPHLATLGALVLAIASIAVLIYFVHHVTGSININRVVADIGKALIDQIRCQPEAEPLRPPPGASAVLAPCNGYIEAIDEAALVRHACAHDLVVMVMRPLGDFVLAGRPIAECSPRCTDDEVAVELGGSFAFSSRRKPGSDPRFAIDELVEIAARALSPGVNDPFTAMACVDWLSAALVEIAQRSDGDLVHRDTGGVIRLIVPGFGFDQALQRGFGRLRTYVAADAIARRYVFDSLSEIIASVSSAAHAGLLRAEFARLESEPA